MAYEDLYCSRGDVTEGCPPGTFTTPSSITASLNATTNTFESDGHGLETNTLIGVRVLEGGALPAPLTEGTPYYAIRTSNARFQVSAAENGSAVDFDDTAEGDLVITREPNFDKVIEERSRWVDTFMPAHAVPFGRTEAVPPVIRRITADLVRKDMMGSSGKQSAVVDETEKNSALRLQDFANGIPLRGSPTPAATNLAVTVAASSTDPNNWGGCIP